MPSPWTRRNISAAGRRLRAEAGQALVELLAVVTIFAFVGMAVLETGMLYHNMNAISNGLKEATWDASYGASNKKIGEIMEAAESNVILGAFMLHRADTFTVEVWQPSLDTATTEVLIDPRRDNDPVNFSGQMLVNGYSRRAANIYRAEGYNIRLGILYQVSYTIPLFGSTPVFSARVPLTVSEPIHARNDEDRDGLVDLYEPELFMAVNGGVSYTAVSHTDNGVSDTPLASGNDVDRDGRPDIDEDTPTIYGTGAAISRTTYSNWNYDFNNDGKEDRFEKPSTGASDTRNLLAHPVIGGPSRIVIP